jgi:hypothetical protein
MIGGLGCNFGVVQRSRGGYAPRHSAYLRGGTLRLANGSVVNFSRRTDVVASFVAKPKGTPAWAADCVQLWTRAVAAEKRADAQEARLVELSIPRVLPREHWVELAQRFAGDLATRGMVVQVDIHCPIASDGGINPHIHFMATMREIVDGEFSKKKARHWNDYFHGNAKVIRHQMAEVLNQFCMEKGVNFRADPRSNAERGLPAAEVRLPRWNVLHHKRTGKKTRAMEQRDKERAARAEVARLEAECRELERVLEDARAGAEFVSAKRAPSVATPKMAPAFRNAAKPAEGGSPPEKLRTPIMGQVSTDSDPGPRYGP